MRKTMVRSWAAAAFVVAGVAGTLVSAGEASATARAFRGKAEGAITGGTLEDPIVDTTGNATHLGNFTRNELIHIDGAGVVSGSATFISKHGNVAVSIAGQVIGLDPLTIEGTYTITDATGRFEGATGTATFLGSLVDGVVTISFEGTIDY